MRFDVVTLFPELFVPFLSVGITRRAFESGQVDVHLSNPREFASGNYRRVDDRPFGGGPGMVMMAQPLEQTLVHIRAQRHDTAPVVLFSPSANGWTTPRYNAGPLDPALFCCAAVTKA